jgi:D-alanine--poly(phosphoribitol) ligase subunit 2
MKKKIYKIIINSLVESVGSSEPELNDDTPIFGGKSNLDSLGLVTLLVNIEQKIEDEMNVSITIADERAISQKNSPFRTVKSLTKFIVDKLKDYE